MRISSSPKKIAVILAAVVAIGLVGGAYWYSHNKNNQADTISQSQKDSVEGQLDRNNRVNDRGGEATPGQTDEKTPITPSLTRWAVSDNTFEAAGFVQGIYESGGNCTYTLTKNSWRITRESSGYKDATTTNCPPVTIPLDEFPEKGEWILVISYSSPTATGSSKGDSLSL